MKEDSTQAEMKQRASEAKDKKGEISSTARIFWETKQIQFIDSSEI